MTYALGRKLRTNTRASASSVNTWNGMSSRLMESGKGPIFAATSGSTSIATAENVDVSSLTAVPHLNSSAFEHWIWDVEAVRALVADQTHGASFFCGGSRNFDRFIDLFDQVFVLEIDLETLKQRLALRTEDDWGGPASVERSTSSVLGSLYS